MVAIQKNIISKKIWFLGDLSRTVSQTFNCYDKSYLRHFNKDYKNMNTTYECAKVDNWEKEDSYEAR